jgi:branched-chain amino acid transport system ATP-binding protein
MPALVEVRDVAVRFGGLQAVAGVSLDLAQHEILGLIGPNGAGKSTLFNVIAGQQRPSAGSVRLQGREIAGGPPERVARLGLVKTFQTSRPFGSMTFLENVMVAALTRTADMGLAAERAAAALDRVGLANRADVPSSGASTGQRKRLEVARALAVEPSVLLLDEPFGGVDVAATDDLVALLRGLRDQGLTLLVIEHNIEAVHRLVDRVIAMHLGEKLCEGTPGQVTRDPRVVKAYMGDDD